MQNNKFKIVADYKPTGDQPQAIDKLTEGVGKGMKHQVLLGATGTGKTFTMANIIEKVQKPTLVLAHNKTLAAQLAAEFRNFFPDNAVRYFVSYYDYYQPEAYIPSRDVYIEKESQVNEEIEKYRNAATQSLLTRRDVLIVASVSCIYGLGSPENYEALAVPVKKGLPIQRNKLLRKLVDMQYVRNDVEFKRGTFRVKGDVVDVFPSYEDRLYRLEFFGDEVDSIKIIDPITGQYFGDVDEYVIFPAKQYVTPEEILKSRVPAIRDELGKQINHFQKYGKELEAVRIKQRTNYDIEMLEEVGYCQGIENYAPIIEGRKPGEPGSCLLDYFPDDYLMFVDESHITIPQIRGMYKGDRARKQNLVDYGFRLPSALDNRPLNFQEFTQRVNQSIYVSATPQEWELLNSIEDAAKTYKKGTIDLEGVISKSKSLPVEQFANLPMEISDYQRDMPKKARADPDETKVKLYNKIITHLNYEDYEKTGIAQQIIRPTGLLDPKVEVRPIIGQVEDLKREVTLRIERNERVLVTTLTKRMAEELTNYLNENGFKVQYLHSDIDTIERVEILKALRLGVYDIVVGINLLREGLDLPEVSLIAILDADKEGFLRNQTSLIQTIGRAARNVDGRVIMYADYMTESMRLAIEETSRRRRIQEEYNAKHGMTPKAIIKEIGDQLVRSKEKESAQENAKNEKSKFVGNKLSEKEAKELIEEYTLKMKQAAEELEFFKAAEYRDMVKELEKIYKFKR
jgi:excinuclease ABC subunit B